MKHENLYPPESAPRRPGQSAPIATAPDHSASNNNTPPIADRREVERYLDRTYARPLSEIAAEMGADFARRWQSGEPGRVQAARDRIEALSPAALRARLDRAILEGDFANEFVLARELDRRMAASRPSRFRQTGGEQ